jgi:hypothetical protein
MAAAAMVLAPAVLRAQDGVEPMGEEATTPSNVAQPKPTQVKKPVSRTEPSSGGSGGVSDFFGSNQPGGNSLTRSSGGIERGGAPDTQSSGQSGSSVYPY